jgi:uncharacterized protein YcaQ
MSNSSARYRIEIYVPAPKRVYGYYVFPFLYGDRPVARVDLKSDRAAGLLLVKGAYSEDQLQVEAIPALADALREMGAWLGLDDVVIDGRGSLAVALTDAIRQESRFLAAAASASRE